MSGSEVEIGKLQEGVYDEDFSYSGDPHLAHPELRGWIVALATEVVEGAVARGLAPKVLEIGAGDGAFTEALLSRDFEVTATEVSRPSVEKLEAKFGENPRFSAVHDEAEDASGVEGGPFPVVFCASVLHHIPDYLAFVEKVTSQHVPAGGSFVSVQDPLRYDTMSSLAHRFDRGAYLIWRLGRGNRLSGLVSLKNRLTGRLDPERPGDMVEYHVVRNGVDEQALEKLLEPSFRQLRVEPYWSNQSRLAQRAGRRFGLTNQFALVAEDRLG